MPIYRGSGLIVPHRGDEALSAVYRGDQLVWTAQAPEVAWGPTESLRNGAYIIEPVYNSAEVWTSRYDHETNEIVVNWTDFTSGGSLDTQVFRVVPLTEPPETGDPIDLNGFFASGPGNYEPGGTLGTDRQSGYDANGGFWWQSAVTGVILGLDVGIKHKPVRPALRPSARVRMVTRCRAYWSGSGLRTAIDLQCTGDLKGAGEVWRAEIRDVVPGDIYTLRSQWAQVLDGHTPASDFSIRTWAAGNLALGPRLHIEVFETWFEEESTGQPYVFESVWAGGGAPGPGAIEHPDPRAPSDMQGVFQLPTQVTGLTDEFSSLWWTWLPDDQPAGYNAFSWGFGFPKTYPDGFRLDWPELIPPPISPYPGGAGKWIVTLGLKQATFYPAGEIRLGPTLGGYISPPKREPTRINYFSCHPTGNHLVKQPENGWHQGWFAASSANGFYTKVTDSTNPLHPKKVIQRTSSVFLDVFGTFLHSMIIRDAPNNDPSELEQPTLFLERGKTYTLSFWMWSNWAGSSGQLTWAPLYEPLDRAVEFEFGEVPANQWVRKSVTFVAEFGTDDPGGPLQPPPTGLDQDRPGEWLGVIYLMGSNGTNNIRRYTGFMLEEGTEVGPYFDGDDLDAVWMGNPGQTMSLYYGEVEE